MLTTTTTTEMRSEPLPNCCVCHGPGVALYSALQDRLFGAPGMWNLRICPRADCGLLWLDPMPLEDDLAKAYQNYYTHERQSPPASVSKRVVRFLGEGYLAGRYGYRQAATGFLKKCAGLLVYVAPLRRPRLDFRLMHLRVEPGARLLEVGCGNGEMLQVLQDAGWLAEGVDFDPAAVAIARGRGLQVRLGALESQRYDNDMFDAVTSSHTIEHIHDPARFLRECHRILKPCGRLAVVTPNTHALGHRYFRRSWLHLDPPRHLYLFNPHSLRRLLEQAGFQKIRIWTAIRDADRSYAASRNIQRCGKHVWGSPQPIPIRAAGIVFQFLEYALVAFGSQLGEEIAVIAEK
jgi:SAM-dependent methyltransferase